MTGSTKVRAQIGVAVAAAALSVGATFAGAGVAQAGEGNGATSCVAQIVPAGNLQDYGISTSLRDKYSSLRPTFMASCFGQQIGQDSRIRVKGVCERKILGIFPRQTPVYGSYERGGLSLVQCSKGNPVPGSTGYDIIQPRGRVSYERPTGELPGHKSDG